MRSFFAVLLALLLTTSCSQLLDVGQQAGQMHVRAEPSSLVLTNSGDEPIYYLAFEAEFAALALFAPCTDPDRCPRLNPGEQEQVPLSEVPGYKRGLGQRVIVYWWHLVPEGAGAWRVEGFRSVNVQLPDR